MGSWGVTCISKHQFKGCTNMGSNIRNGKENKRIWEYHIIWPQRGWKWKFRAELIAGSAHAKLTLTLTKLVGWKKSLPLTQKEMEKTEERNRCYSASVQQTQQDIQGKKTKNCNWNKKMKKLRNTGQQKQNRQICHKKAHLKAFLSQDWQILVTWKTVTEND